MENRPLRAVLFDRDGTLIRDVPYNGDPELVEPVPGAPEAVATLRAHGVAVGVVTNQSGIARGLVTPGQVDAVNARVDRLLGPFDVWRVCPHGEHDGCGCRKPAPGLVIDAMACLGFAPDEVAVVGDIGSDVAAASAAGCRSVLVPTVDTRASEIDSARVVAPTLLAAVRLLLEFAPVHEVAREPRPEPAS
jgi:D-glycero-D-manno-heptose 1,7-bisphosphate phosphatase